MPVFDGPNLLITLDVPTAGVLNLSVEIDLYSTWKEWTIGRYLFNTETDVNGSTERITFTDHGLYTGQAVTYRTDSGTENIGLVDGVEYFVRADFDPGPAYSRNNFELYDTQAHAEAAEPTKTGRIDLTASGGGNGETHRLSADNSKFINAFRTIGGDPLTPGVEAGPYFFLQNQDIGGGDGWRIISTDENQTINYQGNLVGEAADKSLIVVTPTRTVLHLGLQPVTQRVDEILTQTQLALFNGAVSVNTDGGGVPGTGFPIGTESIPVDNLADALTIAANNGWTRFFLTGSITFTAPTGNVVWTGAGTTSDIAFNGVDISDSHYNNLTVTGAVGTITSHIIINNCTVNSITGFRGTILNSSIEGPIVLVSGDTKLFGCISNIAGVGAPVIDANGQTGIDLAVRGYNGGIQLENFTQSDSVITLGMNTGRINIAANCTAFGDLQVRGVATLNNESAIVAGIGKTIDTSSLVDGTDIMITKQMVAGNATVSVDDLTVTVFDEDGTTVIATFDVSADGRIRTRTGP